MVVDVREVRSSREFVGRVVDGELIALDVQRSRLIASVALIRALGGSWDPATLPAPDRLYERPGAGGTAAQDETPGRWSGLGTAIRNLFK